VSRLAGSLLGLIAACGDAGDALPDGAVTIDSAPFVPGPNLVTVRVGFNTPFYTRYRDGSGPWTTPEQVTPGNFELHITDTYEVVAVCGDPTSLVDTQQIRRTFADGDSAFILCFGAGFGPSSPTAVTMRGEMQQPGTIFFDDQVSSAVAPWSFNLQVEPGTHDLIAIGSSSVVIRRDQVVSDAAALPPIDLAVEGAPLVVRRFSVNARADESLASQLDLSTSHEHAILAGTGASIAVPPSTLLHPEDSMRAWVDAKADTTYRATSIAFTGTQSSFSLLPILDQVAYSYGSRTISANWAALPTATLVSLEVYGRSTQALWASQRWIEATGSTHLSFDTLPPDYDPRWHVDIAGPYLRAFTAWDESDPDPRNYRLTSVEDLMNVTGAVAPGSLARRRRLEGRLIEAASRGQ
jgi:hypothetical protein